MTPCRSDFYDLVTNTAVPNEMSGHSTAESPSLFGKNRVDIHGARIKMPRSVTKPVLVIHPGAFGAPKNIAIGVEEQEAPSDVTIPARPVSPASPARRTTARSGLRPREQVADRPLPPTAAQDLREALPRPGGGTRIDPLLAGTLGAGAAVGLVGAGTMLVTIGSANARRRGNVSLSDLEMMAGGVSLIGNGIIAGAIGFYMGTRWHVPALQAVEMVRPGQSAEDVAPSLIPMTQTEIDIDPDSTRNTPATVSRPPDQHDPAGASGSTARPHDHV